MLVTVQHILKLASTR